MNTKELFELINHVWTQSVSVSQFTNMTIIVTKKLSWKDATHEQLSHLTTKFMNLNVPHTVCQELYCKVKLKIT